MQQALQTRISPLADGTDAIPGEPPPPDDSNPTRMRSMNMTSDRANHSLPFSLQILT